MYERETIGASSVLTSPCQNFFGHFPRLSHFFLKRKSPGRKVNIKDKCVTLCVLGVDLHVGSSKTVYSNRSYVDVTHDDVLSLLIVFPTYS